MSIAAISGRTASPNRFGQIEARVFPGLGIGPGLQRRRGRGQHHLRLVQGRPQHRHVAGIVERALLLLVGTVVFLIDDDQARGRGTAGTAPTARRRPAAPRPAPPFSSSAAARSSSRRNAIPRVSRRSAPPPGSGTPRSARSRASSTSACRPLRRHSATASRYTSVLPDPVTPFRSVVPYAPVRIAPRSTRPPRPDPRSGPCPAGRGRAAGRACRAACRPPPPRPLRPAP
jgi:hypothetical protein